ncbi:MAG TPA: DUF1189 family protein, partial [Candidatus Paceibacterota bacterium]|nr:DUF1189 family protein [Candidatus Paceibacterota bacterium]
MNLIKEIEHSVFGPEYYAQVLERPLSFSVRYYLAFALLLALVMTAVLSFALVPQLYVLLDRYGGDIVSVFPEGVTLTVKDGILSSNKKGTIVVPLPESRKVAGEEFMNLAVINPAADFKADDLLKQKALIVIDKDEMLYQSEGERVVVQSLKHTPDVVISRASVTEFFSQIRPMIKVLMPLMVIVIFVLFLAVLALNFVYLLFGALLIMLVSRWRGLRLGYRKAYQVGLHTVTASVLFEYLTFMFWPSFWNNPYFVVIPSLIVMTVAWLNLRSPHENPVVAGE